MLIPEIENNEDLVLSIIIPCYNHGKYILQAIASVVACKDPRCEVIIIDDGSTEPLTQEVMASLKDKGYNVIEQTNQGLARARNAGIKRARGRYILPLDADNKIRPEYLNKSIEILDKFPKIGVVYGNAEFFREKTGIWEVSDFDLSKLLQSNYIDACAVYRKLIWQECGGYDPYMPVQGYEDWDMWIGAAKRGWEFHHVPEVLFDYAVRSGSMVSSCNIPENRRNLMHYVCNKHIDLYAANLANVIAEKEYAALCCRIHADNLQIHADNLQKCLQWTQADLERSQAELQRSQTMMAAMHTSKFWKLRAAWFGIKKMVGLPVD